MTVRGHSGLALTAAFVWLAFWIAGLPDYYRQYPFRSLVAFEVLLLAPVGVAGWLGLRIRRRTSRTRRAVAIAFHFTVPLFLYDLAYCGIHLGHGLGFVATYWWLTTYYVVPWVLFPATAAWLDRADTRAAARAASAPAP